MNADIIQISADGSTVWVHSPVDGSTVGRFSKRFGLDVHNTVSAQLAGVGQCLHCTHEPPGPEEWQRFCELMLEHFGIKVPIEAVQWEISNHHPVARESSRC
jgi:hypothetical protein